MAKFRKKPVVIEAIQFTGDNWREILAFTKSNWPNGNAFYEAPAGMYGNGAGDSFVPVAAWIRRGKSEEKMTAQIGDWIICDEKGKFFPCGHDIFAATYEAVTDGLP